MHHIVIKSSVGNKGRQPDSPGLPAGTNSYVLFTLDKLIYKVVKQLQALLADELAVKLLDLYHYEMRRDELFIDAVYNANAHVLLHEDACFRLETLPSRTLTVQMLETDRTEVVPGAPPPISLFSSKSSHSPGLPELSLIFATLCD